MARFLTIPHTIGASAVISLFIWLIERSSYHTVFLRVVALALAVYVAYWSYIYPFYISPLRHVPTPPGFPLWGHFPIIITTEVGVKQREWHLQYGPVIRYFFPFGAERLSIVDEADLKHMTLKNYYNFPKPERARVWMKQILGEGVLLAEGDAHAQQRKALTTAFSAQSISALSSVFWGKAAVLVDMWRKEMSVQPGQKKSFEVLDWLNRTTLDVISEAGFGFHVNSLENPDAPLRQAYQRLFPFDLESRIAHGLQNLLPYTRYIPWKANRDISASQKEIMRQATLIVEKKTRQVNHQAKDIMGLVVKYNEEVKHTGEDLSLEVMRGQIMTFLGAGHDTTATGMAWTLMMLSKRPDIQEKLRAEIKEFLPVLHEKGVHAAAETYVAEDVDKLPYLNNVCRESLRYIPPIPMTARQSITDDTLGGYFIPAGTTVYVLANTINRLPQYWGKDADEFNPDRWSNLPDSYSSMGYMTFLHGPRGCVGRKFAEVEMKLVLCALLSAFRFEPRTDLEDPETLKMWRLVLRPRDGVTLRVSQV